MWEIWKQQQQQQQSNGGHNSSRNMAKRKQKQKVLSNPIPYYRSFQKLSWSTMGYHYDWTERAYREQNQSPVPDELAKLGPLFACTAAHIANPHGGDHSYQATACIVNYYDEKSVMGGHRDDLEQALTKPIVSISLGRPAIFLLGGKSLDDEPVLPILLRSGDVMILGGDCRLNYHSMARLLPTHLPADQSCAPLPRSDRSTQIQLEQIFGDPNQQVPIDTEKELLNQFLSDHRVNINLRQVYD
jgi:alkylated DNA repair protein alkB family protein 1